ncbi:MAG TPA: hypothetical protein VMG59_13060 [Phycisphaerae bacterium]|nr:hypothetical protein [Phycisphaerae bacterium]
MIQVPVLKSLLQIIMPSMVAWVDQMEQIVLAHGRPLSSSEISDAVELGVVHPERVRYMIADEIPIPAKELAELVRQAGIADEDVMGIAFRYGIFIHSDVVGKELRLLHDLVHVAQFERLGDIQNFIKEYVTACLDYGFGRSPFEVEAREKSEKVMARQASKTMDKMSYHLIIERALARKERNGGHIFSLTMPQR